MVLLRAISLLETFTLQLLGLTGLQFLVLVLLLRFLWAWTKHAILDQLAGYGGCALVQLETKPLETQRGVYDQAPRKFDFDKEWAKWPRSSIPCWDPATLEFLGEVPACGETEVIQMVQKARVAQVQWQTSSFAQRRYLLRTLQNFVLTNMETICTVACRDSGKTVIDAMVGELTVTLEKLRWTIASGEEYLLPEYRTSGLMNLHKTSRLEWVPVGVVGAIVPWNYPFHNVFNPIIAAVFSGNAIVVKVSEFSAWSSQFLLRALRQCLVAAGAPADLVQLAPGYADAGKALVEHSDKVIFVGSVSVGRKVMEAASKAPSITPVILELGGKDPFVVCEDANVDEAMSQLVVRGAFQNMGQNCAGPERFIVYDKVYDKFCEKISTLVKTLSQGAPLGPDGAMVDCGASVHPPSLKNYQRLVDDAKSQGARVLCGGQKAAKLEGQFFEPTVLADVTESMLIAQEETFGPILSIFRVKGTGEEADREAVRLANSCSFALSSCAHSGNEERAAKLCQEFQAGMASVNDVEGTTYLSQSLPFGGYKDSGFGRFAGPEGLRGLCHERSIVQNRASFLKPTIPPPIAYPANGQGELFCKGLNLLLYGSVAQRIQGLIALIKASIPASKTA